MSNLPRFSTWLERNDGRIEESDQELPRILLLTQVFPPYTDVGAARWEGFAPYITTAGWGMDVIMELPSDPGYTDWSRFRKLPANIRVVACERRRPAWSTLLGKLRRRPAPKTTLSVSTPPATSGIINDSQSTIRRLFSTLVRTQQSRRLVRQFSATGRAIIDRSHQLVVSSGPGHFVHVAAGQIATLCSLPHVIDLRDPWGSPKPTLVNQILTDEELRRCEASTLQQAASIITNTSAARDVLRKRYPQLEARILCIPNGSDLPPIAVRETQPTLFQIAHCGALYLDRDPRPFLSAVGLVRKKLKLDSSQIKLVFMGESASVGGRSLPELASEVGIGDIFEERPMGPRDQAWKLLNESMIAVAFQGRNKTQIPGKIFDYVAFPVWVLALVGSESATADILTGSDAIVLEIDDVAAIARSIEDCYVRFMKGDYPRSVGYDGRFSRAKQAERLIATFRTLVA